MYAAPPQGPDLLGKEEQREYQWEMCKRSAGISSPVSTRMFWACADTEQQISGVQHSPDCQWSHPCSTIWQRLDRNSDVSDMDSSHPSIPTSFAYSQIFRYFSQIPYFRKSLGFYFNTFSIINSIKFSLCFLEGRGNTAPRALSPWVNWKLSSLLVSWGRVGEQTAE